MADHVEEAMHEMLDGRDAEIARLNEWRKKAIAAADAILAPMTAEVGRLLEEAPNHPVKVTAFGREIELTAGQFMALYRATDT